MPDAIRATIELMESPASKISIRTSYNIAAMSFSPREIADEIKIHIPAFRISYEPDYRQAIAESWPQSIDDSTALADWGWRPKYNIAEMVSDMLMNVRYEVSGMSEELAISRQQSAISLFAALIF